MGQLYVYEPWPTAVDTLGLCGPLTPTKATCTQEKNGDFRLDLEHPIDAAGKWAKLVPGNLVKADVPLRTPPPFGADGNLPTTIQSATINNVSRADRAVYMRDMATARRVTTLDVGATVYRVRDAGSSDIVMWPGGIGRIIDSARTLIPSVSIAATTEAIEQLVPSPRSRMQLFRIQSVDYDDKSVRVAARQVFYDYSGEMINYAVSSVDAATALTAIVSGDWIMGGYMPYEAYTNLTGTKDVSGWKYVPMVEALMSPSNGMLAYWGGEILRDNWDIYLLDHAGMDRGFTIEYAKNLRGIKYAEDTADVVKHILMIGQTNKGKPLYVPEGTYTVDGVSRTVLSGSVLASSNGINYPVPHLQIMDKGSEAKAAGTLAAQLLAAYTKLIRAAVDKYATELCDYPTITLNVDFIHLGDTAEYAQYRDLQKLFLYDTVRVKHPRLGIDVTTQVNKTVWDCLLDRYDSIELGSVRKNYARSRLAGWQIPGLDSLKSYVNTISSLV